MGHFKNFSRARATGLGVLVASVLVSSSAFAKPPLTGYCITNKAKGSARPSTQCPRGCTPSQGGNDPMFECNSDFSAADEFKILCRCGSEPVTSEFRDVSHPIRGAADLPENRRLASQAAAREYAEAQARAQEERQYEADQKNGLAAARMRKAQAAEALRKAQDNIDSPLNEENTAAKAASRKTARSTAIEADKKAAANLAAVEKRVAAEEKAKPSALASIKKSMTPGADLLKAAKSNSATSGSAAAAPPTPQKAEPGKSIADSLTPSLLKNDNLKEIKSVTDGKIGSRPDDKLPTVPGGPVVSTAKPGAPKADGNKSIAESLTPSILKDGKLAGDKPSGIREVSMRDVKDGKYVDPTAAKPVTGATAPIKDDPINAKLKADLAKIEADRTATEKPAPKPDLTTAKVEADNAKNRVREARVDRDKLQKIADQRTESERKATRSANKIDGKTISAANYEKAEGLRRDSSHFKQEKEESINKLSHANATLATREREKAQADVKVSEAKVDKAPNNAAKTKAMNELATNQARVVKAEDHEKRMLAKVTGPKDGTAPKSGDPAKGDAGTPTTVAGKNPDGSPSTPDGAAGASPDGAPTATGTQAASDGKPAEQVGPGLDELRSEDRMSDGDQRFADVADAEKKAGYIRSEDATNQAGDPEKCGTSGKIGDYGCSGTRNTIQGAQISNMVTQTVGSVATTFAGQSAQQQAMEQGTQAAALRGAASTQKTAAKAQGFAAALNAVFGVTQIGQSQMHKGYVSKINTATDGKNVQADGYQNGKLTDTSVAKNTGEGRDEGKSGFISSGSNQDTQRAIDNFGLQDGTIRTSITVDANLCQRKYGNLPDKSALASCLNRADHEIAARTHQIEGKLSDTKRMLKQIGNNARVEQQAVASEAMSGGMNSLVTGITQGMNAAFNYKAAKQMEEAARNLDRLQNLTPPAPVFTPLGPSNMGPQDAVAPGGGQSLNPGTGTASAATDETQEAPPAFGNLGDPTGTAQPTDPLPGPPSGEFTAGNGPGGGGSGGGLGGVGGASTSPSTGGDTEPQAKMVEQGRTPNYESGGGTFAAGGGGGGAASNGPDLSGLLAQFLPQKEEQAAKGNGILDFGARGLASEAPISLLDRNANIFERIHETYQDKNRRGRVGL